MCYLHSAGVARDAPVGFSPGTAMYAMMIEALIAKGLVRVDMSPGMEEYKLRLGAAVKCVYSMTLWRRSLAADRWRLLKTQGKLPDYMVNLDVTGIGDDVEVIGPAELVQRAIDLAKNIGITASKSQLPANAGSDHQSFEDAGVPAVFFTSGDFDTIHTPHDVFADINAKELDAVGDAAYAMIKSLLAGCPRAGASIA